MCHHACFGQLLWLYCSMEVHLLSVHAVLHSWRVCHVLASVNFFRQPQCLCLLGRCQDVGLPVKNELYHCGDTRPAIHSLMVEVWHEHQGLQSLTRNGSTMAAQLAATRSNGTSGAHKAATVNGTADSPVSKQAKLVPLASSRARKPSFDASSSCQPEEPFPTSSAPASKGSPSSTVSSGDGALTVLESLQKEGRQHMLQNGRALDPQAAAANGPGNTSASQLPAVPPAGLAAEVAPRPGKVCPEDVLDIKGSAASWFTSCSCRRQTLQDSSCKSID